jgi:ketohexokinase
VDTLGAGDVFNAAVIDARLREQDPQTALAAACTLAGRKCCQVGFDGLGAADE